MLENKFRRGEFVCLAEAGDLDSAYGKVSASVSAAPCDQTGDVLRLGPPLWAEDVALTQSDVDPAAADAATFPQVHGAY